MANDRISFTQSKVLNAKPPSDGRRFIYDSKVNGLVLQITSTGSKTYYLYRRIGGTPTRLMLGKVDALTVAAARDMASKQIVKILDGNNPQLEKKLARSVMTLGDAWNEYKGRAKTKESTRIADASRYDTTLKHLAGRRLSSIRPEHVAELHHKVGNDRGHVTANRMIALLRAIYKFAIDELGQHVTNPAIGVKQFKEYPRGRFLGQDELTKFFAALSKEPDPMFQDFFNLALFTGARRGNLMAMKWDDLNLAAGVWSIKASEFKNHEPMTVVLSQPAIEILQRRWKMRLHDVWVFPSHGAKGHLAEPKTAWARLLNRAGLKDLRLHDLRRTMASYQAMGGVSLHAIGKSLGHLTSSATEVYAQFQTSSLRQNVDGAAALMLAARKG